MRIPERNIRRCNVFARLTSHVYTPMFSRSVNPNYSSFSLECVDYIFNVLAIWRQSVFLPITMSNSIFYTSIFLYVYPYSIVLLSVESIKEFKSLVNRLFRRTWKHVNINFTLTKSCLNCIFNVLSSIIIKYTNALPCSENYLWNSFRFHTFQIIHTLSFPYIYSEFTISP